MTTSVRYYIYVYTLLFKGGNLISFVVNKQCFMSFLRGAVTGTKLTMETLSNIKAMVV